MWRGLVIRLGNFPVFQGAYLHPVFWEAMEDIKCFCKRNKAEASFWAAKSWLKLQSEDCQISRVNQIQSPKGISMICPVPFPGVLVAEPSSFSSFKPPVSLFSISIYYSSIAAALIMPVPCDLPLACSQLSPGPAGVPIVPQPEYHRSRPKQQKSGRWGGEGSNWVDHSFPGGGWESRGVLWLTMSLVPASYTRTATWLDHAGSSWNARAVHHNRSSFEQLLYAFHFLFQRARWDSGRNQHEILF